jgi:hypothetical protein
MSMYAQLLEAALRQRPAEPAPPDEGVRVALARVAQTHRELEQRRGVDQDAEAVAAELALQIGYDVALVELAQSLGIETGPSRFEQPLQERRRLEGELRELGITVDDAPAGGENDGA